jgi:micrococcal nuclease
MARSRAAVVAVVAALLGSIGWGWYAGQRAAVTFPAHVVDVIDGDTITVRYRDGRHDTVRLLGVDTPETVDPDRPVECYGPEASAFTKRHLLDRDVTLERDSELRDRYGRLLAYVHVGGDRFNDRLLREGYATLLVISPNGEHGRALLAAELAGQAARAGLWAAC